MKKGWKLSMVEYNEKEGFVSELGAVDLTLREIAKMHPTAKFKICVETGSWFGAFVFKKTLRQNLYVAPNFVNEEPEHKTRVHIW